MSVLEGPDTRSGSPRAVRRVRVVAGILQGLAYVLMLVGVWGVPVVLLLLPSPPATGPSTDAWHLWSLVELTVTSMGGSWLLWTVSDWLRADLPPD